MDEEKNPGNISQPGTSNSSDSKEDLQAGNNDKDIPPAQQPSDRVLPENNGDQEAGMGSGQALQASAFDTNTPQSQNHHSKKWSHYLFDFLMLFLAITTGFFVDNKREYYLEQQRANQFSKQLLADLRLDSLLFERINRNIQSMQKGFDSLLYMLTQNTGTADKEVLETLLPLTFVFDIPATTTTYNQMKGSGSLRYIENMHLTALLQDYYDVLLPRSINIAKTSLDYYSQIINPFYLRHIRIQDYDSFNDTLINKNPVIMERTKQTDQELANIMGSYRSLLKIQVVTMNDPALNKIKETMSLLKAEYDLE